MTVKDKLFEQPVSGDFQFNDRVAEVFDDMLARSVPCYAMVIDMTAGILSSHLQPGDLVYDLGCSTGVTLIELARRFGGLNLSLIGIDNSPAMINKARLKAEMYSKTEVLRFIEDDITTTVLQPAGAIILNYTMQFLPPDRRHDFLKKAYQALKPGGVLVMSEKVISHDPVINCGFLECYLEFKRQQGYSEIEISRKREALENVLVPFSIEENRQLLTQAGFSCLETFFQWFNFVSFVAVK